MKTEYETKVKIAQGKNKQGYQVKNKEKKNVPPKN
jgi:hypothetical protein